MPVQLKKATGPALRQATLPTLKGREKGPELPMSVAAAQQLAELEGELRWRDRVPEERRTMDAAIHDAMDEDYWCCLVFQSKAQRNEFLKKTGLGDVDSQDRGERFIDGMEVAQRLGATLDTPVSATPLQSPARSSRLARLAEERGRPRPK